MYSNNRWAETALGTPIEIFASKDLKDLKGQRPILIMGGILCRCHDVP
jgi:hypothetical protein